jgi:hypothetical protein
MMRWLFSRDRCAALPAAAWARGEFDPTTEFEQHEWISIHLGALESVDHEGGRLPDARHRADDLMGLGLMRWKVTSDKTVGAASRSVSRSTRSPRCRSPSRACRRRRSAAGSRMWRH